MLWKMWLFAVMLLAARRRRRAPAVKRFAGRQKVSWYKSPRDPNRVGHGVRGAPYAIANSLLGLWFMAKVLGKRWADRDLRMTQDHVIVVVHWIKAYEGWKGKGVATGVERHPWSIVRTWEAMGKYRITTIWDQIDYVAKKRLTIGLYIEPKANYFKYEHFVEIKRYADSKGVKLKGYSFYKHQVDLMDAAGIPASQLHPAK